jgi:hypothetical protein
MTRGGGAPWRRARACSRSAGAKPACFRLGLWLSVSTLAAGPASASQPAAALRAVHRDGQTFLVWKEVERLVSAKEPRIADVLAAQALLKKQEESRQAMRYRIYRSSRPLSATRLDASELIAEVKPLSAFNNTVWGLYWYQSENAEKPAPTFVIDERGAPLAPDEGLYVVTATAHARSYYGVVPTLNGVPQTAAFRSAAPVDEAPLATIQPVLQSKRQGQLMYGEGEIRHYVRWVGPPEANVHGVATNWVLGIPSSPHWPAPLQVGLHAWGGTAWNGYGWWYGWKEGTLLLATNDYPPQTWWYGYYDHHGIRPPRPGDIVHNYTERRLLSMLEWVKSRFEVDPSRIFAAGLSMGGSGASALAMRHPHVFAFGISWVGVHDFARSPQFTSGFESLLGAPALKLRTGEGELVWDRLDLPRFVRQNPAAETAFLTFANGKNDSQIGWPQALDFVRALQETRRPFIFTWGQAGHGERAYVPTKNGGGDNASPILPLSRDRSLPAFTRGSLDDDPGNGDPKSGAPQGQINMYLRWDPESLIDRADRYELALYLIASAPRDSCTADVTLRRVQSFKTPPGTRVAWQNLGTGGPLQAGTAVADAYGLITLPEVLIRKRASRLVVQRAAAP